MKKLFFLLIVLTVASTAVLVSCGSSSGDSSEFAGTWLATGEDGGVGKAVIFQLSSESFTRIAFTEETNDMIQEEGQKGSYSTSGNDFSVSVSSEWDDSTQSWQSGSGSFSIPYTYDGSTLTMEVEPGLEVPFNRVVFSQHANLAGTSWGTGALLLNSNGTYSYTEVGYTCSGTWSATADMLRTITTVENGTIMHRPGSGRVFLSVQGSPYDGFLTRKSPVW